MQSFFLRLSRAMAILGGVVLSALILLTCLSIAGRLANGWLHGLEPLAPGLARGLLDLGVGPINGDFELVEAGVAFAIFAFLPLCQITGGHAAVDVFSNLFPARVNRALRWGIEVVFAAVLVLIAVQLLAGMQSKMRSGTVTFLLQFPLWWAYAASLCGAAVSAVVACYIAAARTVEVVTGRAMLPADMGAEH